ncbi:MAG: nickel-dependent hydrogenase large subunit [Firmicutes bacterium]|nr:nickel-dependent hydrogenase large subunit [Bacillota bacterium]
MVVVVHPLNRGIRPIRIELDTDGGKVVGAKAGTTYYWDFANTLKGKDPMDAIQLTQRTSGLDFVAHATAIVRALEEIAAVQLTGIAVLTRNVLLGLDIVYGHITHFYSNVLPDYIPFPEEGPFYNVAGDFRLPPGVRDSMIKNMWRAFEIRQLIHNIMAVLSGKAPHICSVIMGGVTRAVTGAEIVRINSVLKEVAGFVNHEYYNDLVQIEQVYGQYFNIGGGAGNLLTVGEFPRDKAGNCLFSAGVNFQAARFNKKLISMDFTGAWFEAEGTWEGPLAATLKPKPDKPGGYSWVKGALYGNKTCEVGPLARMALTGNAQITGLGKRAMSVLGRYRARLEECKVLLIQIIGWLEQINPGEKPAEHTEMPEEGEAIGVAEASQGSVVHYVSIKKGKIDKYNVLDAYSWNLCPNTREGLKGPMEQALTGLVVTGPEVTADVLRVARSF